MTDPDLAKGEPAAGAVQTNLIRLARESVDVALSGNIKRGLALAFECSSRARESGDRRAELEALNAAARCHSLRNDSINSLAAGIDAAALARTLGDGVALGHALCAIVNTSFTLQLLQECEAFVVRAIEEGLKHADHDLECRARQTYGVLLGDLKRFDDARTQLALAVQAARRDGHAALLLRVEGSLIAVSRKVIRAGYELGDRASLQKEGVKAIASASALIERARAQQVLSLEMTMTGLMGEVHWLIGDIDLGIVETSRAMDLAERSKQPTNLPPLALRLSRMLHERGRLPEALQVLHRGLNVAETLRPTFRIAELCEALAVVETARGANPAADDWRARSEKERGQFDSGRLLAAGFLRRLQAELTADARA